MLIIFFKHFLIYIPKLLAKLEQNVENVLELTKEDMDEYIVGRYDENRKMITLVEKASDRTCFHEFVHSLRNGDVNCEDLQGIIEGFTEYAALRYLISKKHGFEVQYSNKDRFVYSEDKKFWTNSSYVYAPLVLIMQELEVLYDVVNPDETLLTSFLKGENVFAEINKIYEKYYQTLAKKEKVKFDAKEYEFDIMRTSFSLMQKIDSLRLYMLSRIKEERVILSKINEIEEEIKEVLLVINNDHNLDYKLSSLLLTTDYPTAEQRLIACIFGEPVGLEKTYTLKERINQAKQINI